VNSRFCNSAQYFRLWYNEVRRVYVSLQVVHTSIRSKGIRCICSRCVKSWSRNRMRLQTCDDCDALSLRRVHHARLQSQSVVVMIPSASIYPPVPTSATSILRFPCLLIRYMLSTRRRAVHSRFAVSHSVWSNSDFSHNNANTTLLYRHLYSLPWWYKRKKNNNNNNNNKIYKKYFRLWPI